MLTHTVQVKTNCDRSATYTHDLSSAGQKTKTL